VDILFSSRTKAFSDVLKGHLAEVGGTQRLHVVLGICQGREQHARLGRIFFLLGLRCHPVVFVLRRGHLILRARQGDRRRRSRLCGARDARRACRGRGGCRIVARCFRVRHRASAVPRARNGTCFGDRESTGGKGTLIAVAKAPHAPEARSTVVDIIIEQAGGGERLGCVQAEPFHRGAPRRRYPLTVPATDAVAMIAVA
jgi:hypothetical protein